MTSSVQFTRIRGDLTGPISAPMRTSYRLDGSMDATVPKGGEQRDEDDEERIVESYISSVGFPVKEVVRLMEWKGYDVVFDTEGIPCIGLPCFYLVKDSEITVTSTEEAFEILHLLPPEEEDDGDDIERLHMANAYHETTVWGWR